MRLSAWPLALGLAFATPSFAAEADSCARGAGTQAPARGGADLKRLTRRGRAAPGERLAHEVGVLAALHRHRAGAAALARDRDVSRACRRCRSASSATRRSQEVGPLATWFVLTETGQRPAVFLGTSSDRIGSPEGTQAYYVTAAKNAGSGAGVGLRERSTTRSGTTGWNVPFGANVEVVPRVSRSSRCTTDTGRTCSRPMRATAAASR